MELTYRRRNVEGLCQRLIKLCLGSIVLFAESEPRCNIKDSKKLWIMIRFMFLKTRYEVYALAVAIAESKRQCADCKSQCLLSFRIWS